MPNDLPAIREQQQEALDRGDNEAANLAYARELQALAGQAAEVRDEGAKASTVETPSVDRDEIRDILAEYDPIEADRLITEWGGDLADNLAIARRVARDTEIIRDLEELGVPDDPRVLRMLAKAGRRLGYQPGTGRAKKERPAADPPPTTVPASTSARLTGAIRESNNRISQLQAEGRTKEANAEYLAQQAMIARTKGNAPIVNGSTRTS